ncbi:uncharacterized protein MELLADRAFT_110081 [Melampsora larici-populina 98AG31]|uniref:Uncharacterized protein n=1 Tax=Melampsora larici-populina (strain 98AG31 / pathotype 3-4-7) TaxID=747676 RepID=F4RYL2_MELLP|nr:uncharacterized protein MELLADRAFT_110081 [Melampsora larici-populina 98AG31]EGG02492.1 hypothetical protein MELLADRAFT_110081 [Melampsora larici-populina 98AG31]
MYAYSNNNLQGVTLQYPDPWVETAPTLSLPHGGPAAFICFPECVIAVSLTPGTNIEQMVSLKSGATNRIIGGGTKSLSIQPVRESELGASELQRPMPLTAEDCLDRATFKLKTKLDQAVFFGV